MARGIRVAMLKVAMQDPRQWGFDVAFSLTRFDSCEVPYQQVQVQSGARWTHNNHDPTRLSIPSNSMQHQTMLLKQALLILHRANLIYSRRCCFILAWSIPNSHLGKKLLDYKVQKWFNGRLDSSKFKHSSEHRICNSGEPGISIWSIQKRGSVSGLCFNGKLKRDSHWTGSCGFLAAVFEGSECSRSYS